MSYGNSCPAASDSSDCLSEAKDASISCKAISEVRTHPLNHTLRVSSPQSMLLIWPCVPQRGSCWKWDQCFIGHCNLLLVWWGKFFI